MRRSFRITMLSLTSLCWLAGGQALGQNGEILTHSRDMARGLTSPTKINSGAFDRSLKINMDGFPSNTAPGLTASVTSCLSKNGAGVKKVKVTGEISGGTDDAAFTLAPKSARTDSNGCATLAWDLGLIEQAFDLNANAGNHVDISVRHSSGKSADAWQATAQAGKTSGCGDSDACFGPDSNRGRFRVRVTFEPIEGGPQVEGNATVTPDGVTFDFGGDHVMNLAHQAGVVTTTDTLGNPSGSIYANESFVFSPPLGGPAGTYRISVEDTQSPWNKTVEHAARSDAVIPLP